MYPMKISRETKRRVDTLFPASQHDEVITLLSTQCGNNLPNLESLNQIQLERFQFAALKLSNGDLDTLKQAITLAQVDWRDLLMAAGFADNLNAHNLWIP